METFAESKSGIALFLPEDYDIIWSTVILIVVAIFFYKFFLPKFQAIFDERAAKIEGGIAKAEKAQADADAAKKKYEDQLNTARVDAAKIRDDARTEASHIIADARTKAEADAAQITANAQKSIESQQQQALVSLKGEVGALATALAGKILGSKLSDADVQSSMIDSMIDGIDKDPAGKAK
ncbi:F0F1 ATP synthase subunit B [Bifidobacterium primatium]|uniref:ATP synthase subunit b n=1 Tax=Bifidobacterium primatium TaxID=2045438 RepID=A0A2M9HB27_9BIFI|nr:F0F1 ATP synthase subunit B [Bifidobacterium primatium]PJM73991.1 F0F1 ATP synthase subunit B [Bifidobacterium primatium]